MSKHLNKVRKRLETRRRSIDQNIKQRSSVSMLMNRHEEAREDPDFYYQPLNRQESPPSTKGQDFFLMRTLLATSLFLAIAILFNNNSTQLEGARQFIKNSYEQQFQFAAIADWYENQFGRPLALLPLTEDFALGDVNSKQPEAELVYAVPASGGKIREDFKQNGRGVMVETGMNAEVEAVKGGQVISVGDGEQGLGKTVVVQHADGTESIYGMLEEVSVNIYDHIKSGHKIGVVSTSDQAEKGIFYFALKKNDTYVDPSEVISFD
ncbi:M23 family metallopeptidase [Halalkalibacter urbisdiaboli]|uniref:M23 family metallopeptidase n=1 Tax=Halalkalibacter urbisdiaboli TaxID=1960589 RepID=UPI000B442D7B|nr:M23 family metallopeptidase [Halalkalibacter urbisdiaboli]